MPKKVHRSQKSDRTKKEESESDATIGQRIKKLREKNGISLGHLSKLSGIDKMVISRTESGATEPSLRTAKLLASALGIPLADLLGTDDFPTVNRSLDLASFKLGLLNHIATLKKSLQEAEELLKRVDSGTDSTGLSELEKVIELGRKVDLSED